MGLSDDSPSSDSGHASLSGILHEPYCVLFQTSPLEAHDVHLSLVGDVKFDHLVKVLSDFSAIKLLLLLL